MPSENNKRIAKNTLMLYFRMLFSMGVGLYTSRVVLTVLGVEDYGIYSVVGGLVAMFSLLNGSLSSAIQRFLTFELGAGNKDRLKQIFNTSLNILFLLSLLIIILAETVGVWFLNTKMDISENRMDAANWVFQISLITFVLNVISVPYNAAITAHEDFKVYSQISIFEVVLKLCVVLSLKISMPADKLIVYALLLLGIAIIIRLIYGFYCTKHYEECRYSRKIDIPLLKEMLSFSSWSFVGSTGYLFRNQGISIILNMFFGVVVNAAQGIANQITSAVTAFVDSFNAAVNPQITKSYALKNYDEMNHLVFYSTRFSFFIMLILIVPVCVETKYILNLWLNQVPKYSVIFIQLIMINTLINSLANPLGVMANATGKIAVYNCIIGGWSYMIVILSYLFFKFGNNIPQTALIISCVLSAVSLFSRILLVGKIVAPFSIKDFFREVIAKVIIVSISIVVVIALFKIFVFSHLNLPLLHIFILFLFTILIVWFIGMKRQERMILSKKVVDRVRIYLNNKM